MQHLFSRRHPNNQFNTSNNQLTPTPVQQRFSGTISTSIGAQDSSVMDSLGSLEDEKEGILISEEWGRSSRLQKNLLINQNLKLTSNIFAKSEEDEDEEIDGEEDLNAFLEDNNERNILKRNSKNLNEGDKQEQNNNNNQLSHPLVSVV